MSLDLGVLFEDEQLLVLDKPSGLAIHGGARSGEDDVVQRLRRAGLEGAAPVHRLDRGTSGALIVAKSSAVARELSRLFETGQVEKSYLALVRGALGPEPVLVDHAIPRDEGAARVPAQTWLRGLETVEIASSTLRERRYSLVEARPLSGRFHQVRRHLKHLAHPIVGDANYGKSEHDRFVRASFGLARLALHAVGLVIPGRLEVRAPLPLDLSAPLQRMGFALAR